MNNVKSTLSAVAGLLGGAISYLIGGIDNVIITLIIAMIIDYITGIVVAGVFKASKKSKSGGLESKAGYKGLCRKGMILFIVIIAYRLDLMIGANYIRDTVCIGFVVNEALSIFENAGLMGVDIPGIIIKVIKALKSKNDDEGEYK